MARRSLATRFDGNGNIVSILHPNGILDARSYDAAGRLTQVQGTRSNGSLFYARSYELDPEGNPLSMTATRGAAKANGRGQTTSWTETYSYDSRDRLTRTCMDAACSSFFRYRYDPVGNRLRQRTEQGITRYRYDASDELISARDPSGQRELYSYDPNGNQIEKGASRYAYDLENELTSLREDGKRVSYAYSGDGLVASKTTPGDRISYTWDTNAPLAQLALEQKPNSGALIRFYTYGVGPLGYSTPRNSFTYHADSLGSTVELSDEKGASSGSYRYSPYGEDTDSGAPSTPEATSNPIRFSGQYLDQDSGLYYMRAREYDPGIGRFLEVDPKEAEAGEPDLSSYLYAEDDPTLLTDPSGLDPNFSSGKINCKKNRDLCQLIYRSGYKDYFKGRQLADALGKMNDVWGLSTDYILNVAEHKGKIIWVTGPGIDDVSYLYNGTQTRLKPPKGPACSWFCAIGFKVTQIQGCNSTLTCDAELAVNGILFFAPEMSIGTRLMTRYPKLARLLRFRRLAPVGEGGGVEATSALARQSKAAFTAADNIGDWAVKAKHLPSTGGNWAKFERGVDPRKTVQEALRSNRAIFRPNAAVTDTFRVETNLGRTIGTRGETRVRVVVTEAGRVITAFPIK